MFIIKHSNCSFYLFTTNVAAANDINRWTRDIVKAHIFELKEDADLFRDYLRNIGWDAKTILTFGVQKE